MHIDDAAAFLVDFLRKPRPNHGYSTFGYEVYLPRVVVAYLQEKRADSRTFFKLKSLQQSASGGFIPVFSRGGLVSVPSRDIAAGNQEVRRATRWGDR